MINAAINQAKIKHRNISFKGIPTKALFSDVRGIMGNLPEGILKAVKNQRDEVSVFDGFRAFASVLRKFEIEDSKAHSFINVRNSLLQNLGELFSKEEFNFFKKFLPEKDVQSEIFGRASEKLEQNLKKIDALPQGTEVKCDYAGAGGLGQVFRLSFLNSQNYNTMPDMAFKLYRSRWRYVMNVFNFLRAKKSILTDKKEQVDKFISDLLANNQDNDSLIDFIGLVQKRLNSFSALSFLSKLRSDQKYINQYNHGFIPEMRLSMLLKQRYQDDLGRYDVADTYFYDEKKRFALYDFVTDKTPAPTDKVNYSALGIIMCDNHENNYINGRRIDFGGYKYLRSYLDLIIAKQFGKSN